MPADSMPAAEVVVDEALVRRLLVTQHPDLAARPLQLLAFGWDNVLYRLGEDLLVRLPRRAAAADLLNHEQRWLGALAPRFSVPIPVPRRRGRPDADYPWSWSICDYVEGVSALDALLRGGKLDFPALAGTLGRFCAALHQPAPTDAPHNPYRGIPLAERDAGTRHALAQLGASVDGGAILERWEAALAVSPWAAEPRWLHGDLHPGNIVLGPEGRLRAVVDFGDITAGDPATDLAVAWMLLPATHRPAFRAAAGGRDDRGGIDDDTWDRARGWALSLGVAILARSADNAPYRHLGTATIAAVLAD